MSVHSGSLPGLDFLNRVKVKDLVDDRKIATVLHNQKVSVAFEKLIEERILSLPVYLGRGKYGSSVDIIDIVHYVLNAASDEDVRAGRLDGVLNAKTCEEIANISGRNAFLPVEQEMPLARAIELMSKKKKNAHRISVIDAGGELLHILTQSQVLRFLYQNLDQFPDIKNKSVADLHLVKRDVLTVTPNDQVKSAFEKMLTNHVSALAIVNEEGKPIGNFSATDLKLIGMDGDLFAKMLGTVGEFKQHIPVDGVVAQLISVTMDTPLDKVIQQFVVARVHRVYIIDPETQNLQGIISLGDLLSIFV